MISWVSSPPVMPGFYVCMCLYEREKTTERQRENFVCLLFMWLLCFHQMDSRIVKGG